MVEAKVPNFSAPARKIACGFYHSVAIGCLNSEIQGEDPPLHAYAWGRAKYGVLGVFQPTTTTRKGGDNQGEAFLPPTRVELMPEPVFEVSAGTSHTAFLVKRPEDDGGDLWMCGLGTRGRIGAPDPALRGVDRSQGVEDLWFTKEFVRPDFPWAATNMVLRVVCGGDHTLIVTTDNIMYAWGANTEGQCGVSHTKNVERPTKVLLESVPITHFAAGAQHSLCSCSGTLYSWGVSRNGRLGLGVSDSIVHTPTRVPFENDGVMHVSFVACGEAHSGFSDLYGAVFMWGAGSYGRLGSGLEVDSLVPKRLIAFDENFGPRVVIKSIALGGFHSLFLEKAVGKGTEGSQPRLFACGCGAASGLLSEGDNSLVAVPQLVHLPQFSAAGDVNSKGHSRITQIACGMYHNMVLMSSGDLVVWGVGANGRLGLKNELKNEFEALQLRDLTGFDSSRHKIYDPSERRIRKNNAHPHHQKEKTLHWEVKQVALGSLHSAVLTEGGRLYTWGCNADGQLGAACAGDSSYQWTPRELNLQKRQVKAIAAGYEHMLAITSAFELFAWGKGLSGQLGTGYNRNEDYPRRVENFGFPNGTSHQVVAISAGEEHSAAILRVDHHMDLYTWGSAECGMLGLGDGRMSGTSSLPGKVVIPKVAKRARQSGAAQQLAIGDDARSKTNWAEQPVIVCCGQNHTAVVVGAPEAFGYGGPGVTAVSGTPSAVFTFGSGWEGKLGVGSPKNCFSPTQVILPPNVDVKDVSLGAFHSALITQDSDLYMWGRRQMCCEPMGGDRDHLHTPKKFLQIDGQPKIASVACGEYHTFVVTKESRELWVWGKNKEGQLGLGIQGGPDITAPELVSMPQGQVAIVATHSKHTIVKLTNGDTYGWGAQSCGRLGLVDKKPDKFVYDPEKVSAVWASIESMSLNRNIDGEVIPEDSDESGEEAMPVKPQEPVEGDDDNITKMLAKQKVTSFSTMQVLIKQEDRSCIESELENFERRLEKKFLEVIEQIRKLGDAENELSHLQGDIEQSLLGNLRFLPKIMPLPTGDKRLDPRVLAALPVYSELFQVLQTQVSYLAQLAKYLNAEECEVYYRVIDRIFEDRSPRTRCLFLMLVRVLMDKETEESGKRIEDVFHPSTSKAFHLFSRYALSPIHYVDVVHPFTKFQLTKGESKGDTLFAKFKDAYEKSFTIFALNLKEYQEFSGLDRPKVDEQEDRMDYQISLEKFREFILGPFTEALTQVKLPMDLRKLLGHALQAVKIRQFQTSKADESIAEELRPCLPLLRLFCDGILKPMLLKPNLYASKETYLRATGEAIRGDVNMVQNLQAAARFLEHMVENSFENREHKALMSAAKACKPQILTHLLKQADVNSSIEVDLMTDIYLAHFDMSKHHINMATSDCLRLSNMLRKYVNKLRIKESDKLESLCREIPQWDNALISEFAESEADALHNFPIDPRFLLHTTEVAIDRSTKCLMPKELIGQKACEFLLHSFQSGQDSDHTRRSLEALFRELEPISATTFQEMKLEFDRLRSVYRDKSPPNYEMVQRLQDGLRMLEELLNVEARAEDVLQFMSEAIAKRAKFREYLVQVDNALKQIQQEQVAYDRRLKRMIVEYKQLRDFSMTLRLPTKMDSKAKDRSPVPLKLTWIARQMESRRSFSLDPKTMRELNCSVLPMETRSFVELRRMNVIVEVNPQFAVMEKRMRVTFRALPKGGVELIVNVVQGNGGFFSNKSNMNAVKTLVVSEAKLSEMRKADKMEQVKLANPGEDPFFTCVSSKFCDLITDLSRKAV